MTIESPHSKPTQLRVLLIDDNEDMSAILSGSLDNNFLVQHVTSSSDALKALKGNTFDLFLIDIILPDGNGLDICRHLRGTEQYRNAPILMLSAVSAIETKVSGFGVGADDYLVKPFDGRELQARIAAVMKRTHASKEDPTDFNLLEFDLTLQRAYVKAGGTKEGLSLTPVEFRILYMLAKKRGQSVSREEIHAHVWPEDTHVVPENVYTHMYALRKKLREHSINLVSIPGSGYRLEV